MIGRAARCSSGRPTPPRPGSSGRPSPWAAGFFPVLIGAGRGQKKSQGGRRRPFTLAFSFLLLIEAGRVLPGADRGRGGSFPVLIGAGAVWHWFRLHLIHPRGAPGTGAAGTVPPGQFCRLPEGSDSPPSGSEKQV